MKSLTVRVDPDRCVGYGRCATTAPGVFMIDGDTKKAYIEEDQIDGVSPKTIFAAARACPTQAIIIEQFGRRIYPQILEPMQGEIAYHLNETADDTD